LKHRKLAAALTILPGLGYMIIFFLIPLLIVVCYSFLSRGTYGGITLSWTIENYLNVFNPLYLTILWRSVKLAMLTTIFCLLIGYPIAVAIDNMRSRWQLTALMLVVLPSWMNLLIKNYAWIVILRRQGVINTVLQTVGIIDQPLELMFSETAVLIGLVHSYLPFMILPLYAVIEKLDHRLIEAARDLGATKWQAFVRVVIPQTVKGIVVGCMLVFVPALGAFLTPDLLGGANAVMIGNLIHNQIYAVRDWPFGSAIAIVLMTMVMIGLLVVLRSSKTDSEEGDALL
jgi:spermidine/putrescine transport system permease protein